MPELPWEKWYPTNWASEPGLRLCSAATRGIWIEMVNSMMLSQTYKVSGTLEQLAGLCVCKIGEMSVAIEQLKTYKVADVSVQNECTTIINRKRRREHNTSDLRRQAANARWSKRNATALQRDDAKGYAASTSTSASASSERGGIGGENGYVAPPTWEEFWGYCQTQACLLPAEWFARDKWEAANQDNWRNKGNWQAYARRCKTWWENDGRRMSPPPPKVPPTKPEKDIFTKAGFKL